MIEINAGQLVSTYVHLAAIKKYRWPIQLAVRLAIIRTRLEVDASIVLGHLQAIDDSLKAGVSSDVHAILRANRAVLITMMFRTTVIDDYGQVPLSSLPIDFLTDLNLNLATNIEWLFPGVTDVCRQVGFNDEHGARSAGPAQDVQEG